MESRSGGCTGSSGCQEPAALPPRRWTLKPTRNIGRDSRELFSGSLGEATQFDAWLNPLAHALVVKASLLAACGSENRAFTFNIVGLISAPGMNGCGKAPLVGPDAGASQRLAPASRNDSFTAPCEPTGSLSRRLHD